MTVYHFDMDQPVTGTSEQIADYILSLGQIGFQEVRCDVYPQTTAAVPALQPVVQIYHVV